METLFFEIKADCRQFLKKKHLHLKTLSKSVTVLVTLFGELTYFCENNRGRKAADIF